MKELRKVASRVLKTRIQVKKRVFKTRFDVVVSYCGGKMCHADLKSLRLEICLIESRVSKTRDSITPNQVLIESRVFETRDSIRRNQLFILGNSPTQFII